ncbi:MAG: amidase family protein [Phormidesmis sp.]
MTQAIYALDTVTLAKFIRTGQLSPTEVVEAALHRIDWLNPQLNAFCTLVPEQARAEAKRIEAGLLAGEDMGPLAGVPVGIKDLIYTQGIRTTFGSVAYERFVPDEDDIVVARLRAAGAIVLGKTNTSELGYSAVTHNNLFGYSYNPWNPALTPGGSSGGSAVAVATGMASLCLGSDGGGSIRIPSSFCGLYGIKPSMGRVPAYPGCRDERYPGISSWDSLEHIGPMTRTVADSALALSVLVGPDMRDRHSIPSHVNWQDILKGDLCSDMKGLRIAYSEDWGYMAVDSAVREIVQKAVRVFEQDLGCVVEAADPGWADPYDDFAALIALDSDLVGMRKMIEQWGDRIEPYVRDLVLTNWRAEQFTTALMTRKAICNRMWKLMQRYDLLLTPTVSVPPFSYKLLTPPVVAGRPQRVADWLGFTSPLNLTGQPAASIPAGQTIDGLPVGLQIVGRHLDDALVLRASAAYEQVRPWGDRLPKLVR